jgi:hypothetical protein
MSGLLQLQADMTTAAKMMAVHSTATSHTAASSSNTWLQCLYSTSARMVARNVPGLSLFHPGGPHDLAFNETQPTVYHYFDFLTATIISL